MAVLASSAARILVVDDTADVRELYAEYLTMHGYDVLQAADGQEALGATFAHHPAVIVLDLDMPVMDGWSASRILSEDPRTSAVPIIIVTGSTVPEHHRAALAARCVAILQKPLPPAQLREVIEGCFAALT